MSLPSQEGLKEILQQLECHFTWGLQKEHIDPDELEERIAEQIQFLINKSKVQNYNLLAFVKFLNDKKDEALENLQKAEETVPIEYPEGVEKGSLVTWGNYAWLHYHMGNLTESQGYVEKVETTCKQLGSESPYKVELPQIECEKGWALLKFGAWYYEKAKESFEKARDKEPENPEFNSGYAITIYRLEDYYAKKLSGKASSLEPLRLAVKLNPSDIFVTPLLALKLQETNRVKEGENYMKEVLGNHPDVPYVLRYAAKFYRKKGDLETSLQHLKKALSLTPNSGFLHHQIGICYRTQYFTLKKKKFKDQFRSFLKLYELMNLCIFHFQKVVERKTKFVYAYIDLANMYAEKQDLRGADETFQKVFAISNLSATEKQQLHFNYGRFQERHRKSDVNAMKQYLHGLKIENHSFEQKNCERSLKRLMDKTVKKGPICVEVFESIGFMFQRLGLKEKAIEAFESALKMDPGNEEYLSAVMNLKLSLES
ncbi:interferon-induced protein with tetratricopeptide repeats 5-like isoform X2 [Ahaetulla prasina]|uniref:interferon-induced protein with tetratricopeptide repeats 5-like isoform X2 n=1 Tax=Ahaetulla prasina TaxID=499056 RepID=UPI002648A9AB|nr:interferon-induced protein with tetratricopeptide repeats 5-like isoform X2 [Ahaetulla prasina]